MSRFPPSVKTGQAHASLVSIVIPVFNERPGLPALLDHLQPVLARLPLAAEIVFVDDGSQDGSAEFLIDAIRKRPALRLVRLSRNFGKEAALTAGIEHARGDAVIILDADLQDPPELIPEMVSRWLAGTDVVLMQRRSRHGESWFKRLCAYGYYRLLNRTCQSPIPVDTGDFRLMSRRAVDALLSLNERNRYMKGLFAWVGLPTEVMTYDRNPRSAGTSKWNFLGLFGLALEGLTSFSVAPLRWATGIGLIAATLGAVFGLWIVVKAALLGDVIAGYPSLVAIITFLGGIQLVGIGIVGEYVGKTYIESKQRPIYITRDVIGQGGSAPDAIRPFRETPRHVQVS
ncbi:MULTISPECIES: glycosyltransferase family 2 protein [Marinobacter]|uniref:glycosyltransferase family 2 protein n=1 Tax=Marinobacter TaxID=2742 RepID=UPI000DAF36EA|nr:MULTISPECIES: glycosyltransferase family 2 protein [Marinobacter]